MDEHGDDVEGEELAFVDGDGELDGSQFEIDAIQEEEDLEDEATATDETEVSAPAVATKVADAAALDTTPAEHADDSLRELVHEAMPLLQAGNLRPLLNMNGEMSDWVACVNSDGETYYCNLVTNETTWEPPFDLLPLALSERHNSSRGETIHLFASSETPLVGSSSRKSSGADMHQFVKRVLDGSLRRLDPHTQMQLEEARRRHKELEELRDEEVLLGGEHWVEMYDPTHDGFYYYGIHSGEMRWDKPDSYVMQVSSDDVLRMVVRVQCAFRMKLARRKVFQLKLQRGLIQAGPSGGFNSANPWVEVYDPFHKVLYYYCATTNETRWDPPDHYISASEDREMAAAIAIQSMSRSHLARRDVKKRKATIRKKQHELAMEESKKLRELRRKEYAAKTDDERESISRREMLEEEMEQIRDGDLFWGVDKHDQEVIRQQMEEKMLADAEAFWQRVNLTLRRRVEMEMQRSQEEDVGRVEMERISEANESDRMRAAEAEQCQLGDGFWGIQAEERHEEQTRLDMDAEEERSRVVGAKVHIEELYRTWAEEKENRVAQDKIDAVRNEKKYQKQYFKWFYHQCESADDVLDYLWPTKQRYEPPPRKDNQEDESSPATRPSESQKNSGSPAKDPAFVLDDIVLRERLETEYRYSGKSIYTIHDPKDARVLGIRGRYVVSSVSTEAVYAGAAKKAERKPRPTSPTRPMPQSSKPIPNDTEADEEERIRYGVFPELHYNHLLDRNVSAPDPHLPARYNGVPYKSSEMSATREILLGHHTKLTKIPALSHTVPSKQQNHDHHGQTKSPFGSPHRTSFMANAYEKKKKHSSFALAMQENNNNGVDLLSSSLGFASPFFQEANRSRASVSNPMTKEEREAREAQETTQRIRHELQVQFEKHELTIVRDVFVLIDVDESGTINKRELVWALQRDGEIHAVANKSTLLRLLLKQPAHLEELFRHLKMSDTQRDEISWDIFRIFCEEMYISLTQQGILGAVEAAEHPQDLKPKREASAKAKQTTPQPVQQRRKGSVFAEAKEEQLIRTVFTLCDQDCNGVLEIEELQRALYTSSNTELQALVLKSKSLQPLLHESTFIDAFRKFEPLDPRGISEEEFVVFCLEIADIALLNGMV